MNFKSYFICVLAFIAFVPIQIFSQDWDDEDDFYVSRRKGLEYGINLGVYRAHPKSSIFYNGAGWF